MVKDEGSFVVCTSCGHRGYKNPVPCNAVIITNIDHEILFVRRNVAPHKGMWDLPGGFIELHETAEQSVIRETKEELGADIIQPVYLTSAIDTYIYQDLEYQTLCFIFTASVGKQSIRPQDDINAYQFFKPDALPISEVAFESLKPVLRDFVKNVYQHD